MFDKRQMIVWPGYAIRGGMLAVVLAMFSLCACTDATAGDDTRKNEETLLLKAVGEYFKAEQDRNLSRVWDLIAPSSVFKRQSNYDSYVKLMDENPIRVKSYVIEEVVEVSENSDRSKMPDVELVGLVRVKVVLTSDGGKDTEHTSIFTFLKEDGMWFKG